MAFSDTANPIVRPRLLNPDLVLPPSCCSRLPEPRRISLRLRGTLSPSPVARATGSGGLGVCVCLPRPRGHTTPLCCSCAVLRCCRLSLELNTCPTSIPQPRPKSLSLAPSLLVWFHRSAIHAPKICSGGYHLDPRDLCDCYPQHHQQTASSLTKAGNPT
jgi:hypothetical protein